MEGTKMEEKKLVETLERMEKKRCNVRCKFF